jgi:phosphatidylserine decarboxylase
VDQAAADVTMAGQFPIAREGWPFVLGSAAAAGVLFLAGHRRLAMPFAAATLASLGFYRDPEREVPVLAHAALSPADGRVTDIADALDPFVGPSIRVSIFLSPLDVHVNRSPITGLVVGTTYTSGRFIAAYKADAADINERCSIHLQGESARVTVTQIAGVVARRIVCRVAAGDKLQAGERFGMIRFGSRTDCAMPRGTDLRVRVGDRVKGGMTVLGVLA